MPGQLTLSLWFVACGRDERVVPASELRSADDVAPMLLADDTATLGSTGDTGAPAQARAFMLVVDMSCSMMGGTPDAPVNWARAAQLTFLDTFEQDPRPGDMLGLSMFATYAVTFPTPGAPSGTRVLTDTPTVYERPWAPLADVGLRGGGLRRLFRGVCDTGVTGGTCRTADAPDYEVVAVGGTLAPHPTSGILGRYTNPQPAMLQAVNELTDKAGAHYRGMVFLSDGVPNVGGGTTGASYAAIAAWAEDIHVWTVMVSPTGFGDPAFMQSLVRGDGEFLSTSVPSELPDLYAGIAESIP